MCIYIYIYIGIHVYRDGRLSEISYNFSVFTRISVTEREIIAWCVSGNVSNRQGHRRGLRKIAGQSRFAANSFGTSARPRVLNWTLRVPSRLPLPRGFSQKLEHSSLTGKLYERVTLFREQFQLSLESCTEHF